MSDIVTDSAVFPHVFDMALNGGDLDRIAALYDDDATIRVQSGDTHSGQVAIRAELGQMIAAGANITNTLRHIFRHGDTALIIVDYVLRLTTPDGSPIEVKGTATNVLQRHPEKGWRMIIANPQGMA